MHGLYENGYVPFVDYDFRKTLMLENLQLLCPYRPGFFGVLGLNKLIQKEFRDTSFKDPDTANTTDTTITSTIHETE